MLGVSPSKLLSVGADLCLHLYRAAPWGKARWDALFAIRLVDKIWNVIYNGLHATERDADFIKRQEYSAGKRVY